MGADHGGFALKEVLKAYLTEKGIETVDYGTYNGTDSVDYPIYAKAVTPEIIFSLDTFRESKKFIFIGSSTLTSLQTYHFSNTRVIW